MHLHALGVCMLSDVHKHVYMFWIHVCAIVHFGVCMHMLTCLNCVCTHSYVSEYMCIFPCVLRYAYTCVHMYAYVCMYPHVFRCICMFSGVSICLQVCECIHLTLYVFGSNFFHVCIYVRVFSGVSVYSYVYLCPCVFRCVHMLLDLWPTALIQFSSGLDLSPLLCYCFCSHSSHNGRTELPGHQNLMV